MGIISILHSAFVKGKDLRKRYMSKKVLDAIWKNSLKYVELKPLTKDQIGQIHAYWGGYNIKYTTRWHQLLFSLTGVFRPEYEPFEICGFVQDKLSTPLKQRYFDDKGLYRMLLSGYNIPVRVAECVGGIYFLPESHGQREVTFEEFKKQLNNIKKCVFKPSVGTDGGRGVCLFETIDGVVTDSNATIDDFIQSLQEANIKDFCIERKIEECDNLQCLNPTSCNSLRIHTYRNRRLGVIKYISAYVRIGKLGKLVDNAYSGGICGQIHDDGMLHGAKSVYPYKVFTETESGVNIENYKIDNFKKMVDTVVSAHSNLTMFDLIGWDVTVDKEGNVVIIEFNPNPDVRIEQCIFDTTCLLGQQNDIVEQALFNY